MAINPSYYSDLDQKKYRFGVEMEQGSFWNPKVGDLVVLKEGSGAVSRAPRGKLGQIIEPRSYCPANHFVVRFAGEPVIAPLRYFHKDNLLHILPVQRLSDFKSKVVAPPSAKPAPKAKKPAQKKVVDMSLPTLEQFVQAKKAEKAGIKKPVQTSMKEVKHMAKEGILERVKNATNKNVAGQCDLAKQAVVLEAARVLNVQLVKVASAKLPLMLRGYAGTPIGKAVIANALNIAMEAALPNLPANDPRKKIAEAAVVMSYQEFLAGFKAEEMLDELFNTPALRGLVGQVAEQE